MDDVISRADAIDDLRGKDPSQVWDTADVEVWVNALPSAQPDPEEFEWCTDCKEYDKERHCCQRYNRVIRGAVEEAKEERKTGKAIVKSTGYRGYWACDQCGTEIKHTDNFCPNCGAKMEGEQA